MAKTKKRFQTGSEVMRTYVPDYAPIRQTGEDDREREIGSGKEVAEELLMEFRSRFEKRPKSNTAYKPAPGGPEIRLQGG
jgi:hypothetical protein